MAALNLISGAFLTENAVFRDLDPLLRIKKCDERAKRLKTENPITYPSKYFTPPPLCIFEPRNSHFSLIWF